MEYFDISRLKKSRSIKIIFFKTILVITSTIITLLICETISSFIFIDNFGIFPRYVTDVKYGDFRIRRNMPYAHYWHKSADGNWEFKINNSGFRDERDFTYQKSPGVIRVLVLGDSFTIGYEVNHNDTYSAVIERYLLKNSINAQVINAGMSGNSNAEELVFYEQEGWKYKPDIVVLGFFENDLDDNVKSDLYRLDSCQIMVNKCEYLPAIKISNYLNSSGVYRWISEHSYLFNLVVNIITEIVKEYLEKFNLSNIDQVAANNQTPFISNQEYKEQLSLALINRIYKIAQSYHSYFILLDIPNRQLTSSVPHKNSCNPLNLPIADIYLDSVKYLKQYQGVINLYQPHGQHHWTKFSHLIAGELVGKEILEYLQRR